MKWVKFPKRHFNSLFFIHSTDIFQVATSAGAVPGTRDPTNHLGLRGLAGDTESASTVSPGARTGPVVRLPRPTSQRCSWLWSSGALVSSSMKRSRLGKLGGSRAMEAGNRVPTLGGKAGRGGCRWEWGGGVDGS